MSLHPSRLPDSRSMLSRPMGRIWPAPDVPATTLPERQDAQLYRSIMWSEFRLIIERVLGENREYLALGDEEAFALLMDVVWNGRTHAETAQDQCRVEDLEDRHREFADSGALSTFLFLYPTLHFRVTELVQTSRSASERNKERRDKRGA